MGMDVPWGVGTAGVPRSEPLFRVGVFPQETYFWVQKQSLLALLIFPSSLSLLTSMWALLFPPNTSEGTRTQNYWN